MADLRIRFDDTFNDVIDELRERSILVSLSQIALFAGALGYSLREKVARSRGNLDVRLAVIENAYGARELIDAIAFIEESVGSGKVPETLDDEDKAAIFEQYVNGGLASLKRTKDSGKSLPTEVNFLINQKLQNSLAQPGEEILPDFKS